MPTPPKPFSVISSEKKSHRTKAEMQQRKNEEAALLSGTAIKSRKEVRENDIARKEYLRVSKLLKSIGKNDALYEPVVNRYCMIQAECTELEERREFFIKTMEELKEGFKDCAEVMDAESKAQYLIEFSREIGKITANTLKIDSMIQQKRKMLLDIEKENVMTVASSLRSIPKKVEKKENALLRALNDG